MALRISSMCPKLNRNALAYAATSFGSQLINSIFVFYYVKFFLNIYNISDYWFRVSQAVYLVWNTLNDPLFGYFQDNCSAWAVLRSRRLTILYGAPLFTLSFLLPWFEWSNLGLPVSKEMLVALHLMTSLCLFDALFTFVLLAHCAVFTEMSRDHENRLRLVKYAQVGSTFGSCGVFLCESVSHHLDSIVDFQTVCIILATVSCVAMVYTGLNITTNMDSLRDTDPGENYSDNESIFKLTFQIVRERDFLAFIATNFCQILVATFWANFLAIFGDQLLPELSSSLRSLLYGSSTLLPRVIVLMSSGIIRRVGYFRVIMGSFILEIIMCVIMLTCGIEYKSLMFVHILICSSISDAIFSLFNLCLSDIIDSDQALYKRRTPLSSMVYGTNALFTKPAISIAPVLIVSILNRYNYNTLQSDGGASLSDEILQDLHGAMFRVICLLPLSLAVVRIFVWGYYTIRKSHDSQGTHPNGPCINT